MNYEKLIGQTRLFDPTFLSTLGDIVTEQIGEFILVL